MKPSVVIVDDHQIFRTGVRAEIEDLVDVRGEAAEVEEAVQRSCVASRTPTLATSHCP